MRVTRCVTAGVVTGVVTLLVGWTARDEATPRVALWTVRATKAVEAQAATEGRSNELAQIVEATNSRLPVAIAGSARFDVVSRTDLEAVIKEWNLVDFSASVNQLDPQTAKSLSLVGAKYAAAFEVTAFQDITQRTALQGPLGTTHAERRSIQITGTLKVFDATTGVLATSAFVDVNDSATNEVLQGVEQQGRPTNALLAKAVGTLCGQVVAQLEATVPPTKGATSNGATSARGSSGERTVRDRGPIGTIEHPRRIAVFVKDRAQSVDDEKVRQVEDWVVATLARPGIAVLRREEVMNAIKRFAAAGPNAGTQQLAEGDLDRLVSDATSARNLASLLGADGFVVVAIDSLDERNLDWSDPSSGSVLAGRQYTLRTTWGVVAGPDGATIASGSDTQRENVRANQAGQLVANPTNELLERAAASLGQAAAAAVAQHSERLTLQAPECSVSFDVVLADLHLPIVRRTEGGAFALESGQIGLGAMGVAVLVDGITIATTPCAVRLSEGVHTLRLERAGLEPINQMIHAHDGLSLSIPMRMSTDGLARWREESRFLEELKDGEVLREVQLDRAKALADLMRRMNINIDIDTSNVRNLSVGAETLWGQLLDEP
jgi:hypothetical protein